MKDNDPKLFIDSYDDEIDLFEVLDILIKGKWLIASITAFTSIVALIYSLMLPNIYESKALLVPVETSSGVSSTLQGYSGLASLAGVNLPSQGSESNSTKAMEKVQSLSFFESNILPNIFLPELMALKSWNSSWNHQTNSLEFNQAVYDSADDTWVRKFSYPQKQIPSAQESFKEFKDMHLNLNEEKETGFIEISIKHQSPFIAQEWVNLVVNQINAFYRAKDKAEAEKSVSYINSQIIKTNYTEIKEVLAELLQQETQKLTLIEANPLYVFDFIDPPAVMEKKSEPSRALICILGALLGALLSFFILLIKNYQLKLKST